MKVAICASSFVCTLVNLVYRKTQVAVDAAQVAVDAAQVPVDGNHAPL